MAKLIINPTSGARKEIPVEEKVLSIGRDPSNDLVLSDSMVSRRHAIMERRGEQYVLRDNDSSNGTLLNGDRVVSDQPLHDGDLIAIGSARLLFQADHVEDKAEKPAALPPVAKPLGSAAGASGEPACPACGSLTNPSDRYCRRCGKEFTTRRERQAVCENCKATVPLPADFCSACGKVLMNEPNKHHLPTRPLSRDVINRHLDQRMTGATPAGRVPITPRPPSPGSKPGSKPAKRSGGVEQVPARRPVAAPASAKEAPAGFWIRLVACLIDGLIVSMPMTIAGGIWVLFFLPSGGEVDRALPLVGFIVVAAGAVLTSLLSILYPIYFWGVRGATPGKSLLGIKVATAQGESPIGMKRALLRLVGYVINGFTFGIGFLLVAFSADKRGLHDRLAETSVVRRR